MLSAFVMLVLAIRAEAQPACTSGLQCPQDDEPTSLLQVSKAVKTGTQHSEDSALVVEGEDLSADDEAEDICKKVCVTANVADCGSAHAQNMCSLFMRGWSAVSASLTGQFFISGPFDLVHKAMNQRNLPVKVEYGALDWAWLCVSKTMPGAGKQVKEKIVKMIGALSPFASLATAGSKGAVATQYANMLYDLGPVGAAIVDILNNPTSINIDTVEESIMEKYQADLVKAYGDKGVAIKLVADLGYHDSEENCMQFSNVVKKEKPQKAAYVYYGEGENEKPLTTEKLMDFATLLLASGDGKIQQPKDVKTKSGKQGK
jgi:hypothetical protein